MAKDLPANAGDGRDAGSIPGLGRSPGGGNGNPLQYSWRIPRTSVLISWLQSPSAVILQPQNIKSVTVSIVPPSICHEVMGPDAMIFVDFRPRGGLFVP